MMQHKLFRSVLVVAASIAAGVSSRAALTSTEVTQGVFALELGGPNECMICLGEYGKDAGNRVHNQCPTCKNNRSTDICDNPCQGIYNAGGNGRCLGCNHNRGNAYPEAAAPAVTNASSNYYHSMSLPSALPNTEANTVRDLGRCPGYGANWDRNRWLNGDMPKKEYKSLRRTDWNFRQALDAFRRAYATAKNLFLTHYSMSDYEFRHIERHSSLNERTADGKKPYRKFIAFIKEYEQGEGRSLDWLLRRSSRARRAVQRMPQPLRDMLESMKISWHKNVSRTSRHRKNRARVVTILRAFDLPGWNRAFYGSSGNTNSSVYYYYVLAGAGAEDSKIEDAASAADEELPKLSKEEEEEDKEPAQQEDEEGKDSDEEEAEEDEGAQTSTNSAKGADISTKESFLKKHAVPVAAISAVVLVGLGLVAFFLCRKTDQESEL